MPPPTGGGGEFSYSLLRIELLNRLREGERARGERPSEGAKGQERASEGAKGRERAREREI